MCINVAFMRTTNTFDILKDDQVDNVYHSSVMSSESRAPKTRQVMQNAGVLILYLTEKIIRNCSPQTSIIIVSFVLL